MGRRQEFIASLILGGALTLTGCTGGDDVFPVEPSLPADSVTDAETCTAFGDVLTIVGNVDVAVSEGRMEQQEQRGWYGLATRVLDRLPMRGDGAVSDALGALQKVAPPIPAGGAGLTMLGSVEFHDATRELNLACTEAGSELTVEGFTGG